MPTPPKQCSDPPQGYSPPFHTILELRFPTGFTGVSAQTSQKVRIMQDSRGFFSPRE